MTNSNKRNSYILIVCGLILLSLGIFLSVSIGAKDIDFSTMVNSVFNEIRAVKDGNYVFLNASPFFSQAYNPMGRKLLLEEVKNALM